MGTCAMARSSSRDSANAAEGSGAWASWTTGETAGEFLDDPQRTVGVPDQRP